MSYETILLDSNNAILTITFNRLADNNALNDMLIYDLLDAITHADEEIKIIVLQGQEGVFCTGMDFKSFLENSEQMNELDFYEFSANYMQLLHTLATISKVTVAKVDGKVLAGGVGLATACDLVYATTRSTFTLTEALWGLLPANLMPYLIRRMGFQSAYHLTLTAETIPAETAKDCHLVDEILDDMEKTFSQKILRLCRLQVETILDLKNYFNALSDVSEEKRQLAIDTLATLIAKPRVQKNISDFITKGNFPWS